VLLVQIPSGHFRKGPSTTKRVVLDCAHTVLGTTGGRLLPRFAHHSAPLEGGAAAQGVPHPPDVRVVLRGIHARREVEGTEQIPDIRAAISMRRVWYAGPGLCPLPAEFRILTALRHP
jgi:hypothetical protein